MDRLSRLLSDKNFDQPSEITRIKKYVLDELKANVSVQVRERDIVIIVSSAALANTLRLRSPEIKQRCKLTKRLTFRIG